MTYHATNFALIYNSREKDGIVIAIPDIIDCDTNKLKEALAALERVERLIREVYHAAVTTIEGDY